MVPGFKRAHDRVNRRHTARKNLRRSPALERCQVGLNPVARRIRHPRVLITLMLADLFLKVSGGCVDRRTDRARRSIGFLPNVDSGSAKTLLLADQGNS